MKKTTKNTEIRHHNQIIHRLNLLIEAKHVRKNVGSVLLALANFANPKGLCFPSQTSLSEITGYKRETVNRLISKASKLNLISKSSNRKPLTVGNKTYFPRTIYKINTQMISKLVKSIFKMTTSAKKPKETSKTDHSATLKNDHTNNPTGILRSNTVAKAKPSNVILSLSQILSKATQNEQEHHNKLRHSSARKRGLKDWQVSKGLRKSDTQIKQEQKTSKLNSKARERVRPLIELFTNLQNKLAAYHPKINPKAFSTDDLNQLNEIKEKLLALNVNPPVNVMADYRLKEFIV